ncbi:beta-carotene 15,15'-monooxygenase [Scardovia wiggsiae]|uniref:beta-carotene 15,15'-monooxygenase n=1 Tax=Scardovia wiggsiae TaxID=230143 RepID=UPI00374F653F
MDGSMAGGNGGSQEAVRGMRDSGSEVGKASLADTVAEAVAQSENSTRAATVSTSLAAVVTLEDDLRYFPETLVSLLRQTVLPSEIFLAYCGQAHISHIASGSCRNIMVPAHGGTVKIRVIPVKAGSFIAAVDGALNYARDNGIISNRVRQLLLLHDDSRPVGEQYIESLTEAQRNNPSASVIGTKQMGWNGETLHNAGYYAAPGHRVNSLVVDGEQDQEQYDSRSDVFAVSLSGALVDMDVWLHASDGNYPFGTFGQSRDFCRRVCLGGGRVIIASQVKTAHLRARFEGMRTQKGQPAGHGSGAPVPSYGAQAKARDTYYYSDISVIRWLLSWFWKWLSSFILFAKLLGRKQVYQACVEMCAPWRDLGNIFTMISARMRVASHSRVSARDLSLLSVSRDRVKSWNDRVRAFSDEGSNTVLDPLAKAHLRARKRIRYTWAAIMAAVMLAVGLAVNFGILRAAFTGSVLSSGSLTPSGATLGQLARSATSYWSYASGLGAHAAPAPFSLVLLIMSLVTLGHVEYAPTVIILLTAPCAALSFWALAGTVTRSNAVRITAGCAWAAGGMFMGFYSLGNLPLLVSSVFLPASVAFTLKALGMYRTEEPERPAPSAQNGACAALCFMAAALCEPQLMIVWAVSCAAFALFARSHKSYLLLIPIPALAALLPTVIDVIRYWDKGAWRQIFIDVNTASPAAAGSSATSLLGQMRAVFSPGNFTGGGAVSAAVLWAAVIGFAVVAVLSVVSLFLPIVLRASRMMWSLMLGGALAAVLSSRVTIAVDAGGYSKGSVMPGLMVILLGMLTCACMAAGTGVKTFTAFSRRITSEGTVESAAVLNPAVLAGRGVIAVILALCSAAWAWSGFAAPAAPGRITASQNQLPAVVQDYLASNPARRILAVDASVAQDLTYHSMATSRGDILDINPSIQAQSVSYRLGQKVSPSVQAAEDTGRKISSALSLLIAGASSSAVDQLSSLGFGGIYVVHTAEDGSAQLISHLIASNGTESVVSTAQGTYIRFSVDDTNTHGIALIQETRYSGSPWRYAWIAVMAVTLIIYCIVAFPRRNRYSQEQA